MSDTFAFTDLNQSQDLFQGDTRVITKLKQGWLILLLLLLLSLFVPMGKFVFTGCTMRDNTSQDRQWYTQHTTSTAPVTTYST